MVAARAREYYDKQARERQTAPLMKGVEKPVPANLPERKGDARDQAGKALGVVGDLGGVSGRWTWCCHVSLKLYPNLYPGKKLTKKGLRKRP